MAKQKLETRIQNASLLAVGTMPDVLVWRQMVGKFRAMDNPDRIVSVGEPGMSDCMMVVSVQITPEMVGKTVGVAVAAEFKTPSPGSKQALHQKTWERAFTSRGGAVYRVVRSPQDMLDLVQDVKNGNCWR